MDSQRKLKEFLTALSFTNLFGGENEHVNDLIQDIEDKLRELDQFIEDDLFEKGEFENTKDSDNESLPEDNDDTEDDDTEGEDSKEWDY